jgi:hypothetical protein
MGDANYINNVLPAQLAMLDEVRYFGVTVTSSGGLTTTAADLANINTIQAKNRRPSRSRSAPARHHARRLENAAGRGGIDLR